jgi:hypothetical protein
MSKWFVVATVALGLFFAAPLMAQNGKGNWGNGKSG